MASPIICSKIETGSNNYGRVFVINHQPWLYAKAVKTGCVARGAQCKWVEDEEIATLAEEASKVLDIDYCGVDIIRDADGKL